MRCPKCAYSNLPISYNCIRCGDALRSREEVEKAIKLWKDMPEPDRSELEAKIRAEQERFDKYVESLRKNRLLHSIIGGVLGGFAGIFTGWFIVPDLILGSLAGYELNRRGGGQYTGMVLFGLAYVISFLLKGSVSLIVFGTPSAFYVAVWSGGALFCFGMGMAFGIHLDFKQIDKSF